MEEIEFVDPKYTNLIKEELCDDLLSEYGESIEDTEKCGDIFILFDDTLIFSCFLCNKKYITIENFRRHFRNHSDNTGHKDLDNLGIPKVEVQENDVQKFDPDSMMSANDFPDPSIHDDSSSSMLETWTGVKSSNVNSGKGYITKTSEQDPEPAFRTEKFRIDENPKQHQSKDCRTSSEISQEQTHTKEKLRSHKELKKQPTDSVKKVYQCEMCSESFPTLALRRSHLAKEHEDDTFDCEICFKRMTSLKSLKYHKLIHIEERMKSLGPECVCQHCGKMCRSKPEKIIHERIHTGEKPFKCSYCNKAFHSKGLRRQHEGRHKYKGCFKCSYCAKEFTTRHVMLDHEEGHKGENSFKCVTCAKTFSTARRLKYHEKIHTGIKPHKCEICSKRFFKSFDLKLHQLIHSGQRQFKCNLCPATFVQKPNLNSHLRAIHSNSRPHKCTYCDKSFKCSSTLKVHIRSHTNEKPYQCEQCGVSYKTASRLSIHKKKIHSTERPFKCSICEKAFAVSSNLKDHMITHSSERPFECPTCQAKFPAKKHLKAHQKIHSDVKKYICKICGKAYAQNAGLYGHMKTHGTQLN